MFLRHSVYTVFHKKPFLINYHILFKYFELVFLQLQLVKISCKLLIISVNYEKTKRGPFYENTVYDKLGGPFIHS